MHNFLFLKLILSASYLDHRGATAFDILFLLVVWLLHDDGEARFVYHATDAHTEGDGFLGGFSRQ